MTNTEQPGLDAVESGEYLLIPKATVDFLTGAKPDESGQWFGDQPKGPRRQFWWREKLNNLQPAPDTVGAPGEAQIKAEAFAEAVQIAQKVREDGFLTTETIFRLSRRQSEYATLLATPLQLDEDRKSDDLLSQEALDIALDAAMQVVTSGAPKTPEDERAMEIAHDKEYARVLVSTYLSALSKRAGERPKTKKVETDEEARERMMRGDLR